MKSYECLSGSLDSAQVLDTFPHAAVLELNEVWQFVGVQLVNAVFDVVIQHEGKELYLVGVISIEQSIPMAIHALFARYWRLRIGDIGKNIVEVAIRSVDDLTDRPKLLAPKAGFFQAFE